MRVKAILKLRGNNNIETLMWDACAYDDGSVAACSNLSFSQVARSNGLRHMNARLSDCTIKEQCTVGCFCEKRESNL